MFLWERLLEPQPFGDVIFVLLFPAQEIVAESFFIGRLSELQSFGDVISVLLLLVHEIVAGCFFYREALFFGVSIPA